MKNLLILLIPIFSFCSLSCTNEDSTCFKNAKVPVEPVSGIKSIISKDGRYNIYCTNDSVSYKIYNINNSDFTTYTEIISEDKYDIIRDGVDLRFIKLKPYFIISYDDCPDSDYSIFQIHREMAKNDKVIPAEIGINFNRRGLTDEHLKEIIDSGWEVVNHGWNHSRLEAVGITTDLKKGDNKIGGWFVHTFLPKSEILIRGGGKYTIESNGTDTNGNYILINPPFIKDYNRGTLLSLSSMQLEKELFYGVEEFYDTFGYKIENFTYPYTVYDERTVNLLSTKYMSARSYNGELKKGGKNLRNPGINEFPFLENRFSLNSADFIINFTKSEIDIVLDIIVEKRAMGYQFSHTWDKNFDTDKLKYLITTCEKKGIEIITRKYLFDYYEIF